MIAAEFIKKWHNNPLTERAGAQTYFNDLCGMLGVVTPNDPNSYCFERGAARTGAGHGWADVWKRGCFAWESKAPGKDLAAALKQLMTYALALDNPPLLVVSDREIIQIHTHFTGTPSEVHTILLADIGLQENQNKLRALFDKPEYFKPRVTTFDVTEEAAGRMGEVAKRLTARGNSPVVVAHFLIQCVFCMFAEDVGILPAKLFATVLGKSRPDGGKAQTRLENLFKAMKIGGEFALETIPWFNGGLFELVDVPALEIDDVAELLDAAQMNWSAIEPAILGTLFERGLNPDMRSQLGAHYTDPATIMKLVQPVIIDPLEKEWASIHERIAKLEPGFGYVGARNNQRPNSKLQEGQSLFAEFLERLKAFRVLDPACGSGNFLYLSLKALKDLEHKANLEAESLGLNRQIGIETCPANVLGIELNPYAAELARVTVWIGEIQWMLSHGYNYRANPILATLDHIEQRDAIVSPSVTEPVWPQCDVIVGNPPFLGGARIRGELGDEYYDSLRDLYGTKIQGRADLVVYWFEKARAHIKAGHCERGGLVATNSIRQVANREVLSRICESSRIYCAWSDEPWVNAGAAVRVSLVCFGNDTSPPTLDGESVSEIYPDLRSGDNLTLAQPLPENASASFFGLALAGNFTVSQDTALEWLKLPNPNARPNSDVVRPLWNGVDLTGRWDGRWTIDFGPTMDEAEAMLYEKPFEYVVQHVKPIRASNNRPSRAKKWWRHGEARPALRRAISGLTRYIATSEKSKHRFFVWVPEAVAPDNRLIAIARNDDITFGIVSSRMHVTWALAVGSTLEDRPAYATTTCFETFPFPAGLTPNLNPAEYSNPASSRIASAAFNLNQLRESWLNPPEWVNWTRVPAEEAANFPVRSLVKLGHEADLKKRTLTNLYNQMPTWLRRSQEELDMAVATAYGWTDYSLEMSDEEILRRLLALNLARS